MTLRDLELSRYPGIQRQGLYNCIHLNLRVIDRDDIDLGRNLLPLKGGGSGSC